MDHSLAHAADQVHCIYRSAGIFKSVDDEKLDEKVRVPVRGQETLAFVSPCHTHRIDVGDTTRLRFDLALIRGDHL